MVLSSLFQAVGKLSPRLPLACTASIVVTAADLIKNYDHSQPGSLLLFCGARARCAIGSSSWAIFASPNRLDLRSRTDKLIFS